MLVSDFIGHIFAAQESSRKILNSSSDVSVHCSVVAEFTSAIQHIFFSPSDLPHNNHLCDRERFNQDDWMHLDVEMLLTFRLHIFSLLTNGQYRRQGLKFRLRRNFSFPLGTGKKYFGIFGKFRFENSKKFVRNSPKFIRRSPGFHRKTKWLTLIDELYLQGASAKLWSNNWIQAFIGTRKQ